MTDEAFAELLLKPQADTDSMEQAQDRDELKEMQAALSSYGRETLHWAERRSASQPSLASRVHSQERWASLPRWALALVALVTIAGGVAHVATERFEDSQVTVAAPAPTVNHAVTAAEIAEDNHLLSSIDAELSYHAVSPVDDLRLHDGRTAEHTLTAGVTD